MLRRLHCSRQVIIFPAFCYLVSQVISLGGRAWCEGPSTPRAVLPRQATRLVVCHLLCKARPRDMIGGYALSHLMYGSA